MPVIIKYEKLGNFGHIWGNLDFDLGIFQDLKVRTLTTKPEGAGGPVPRWSLTGTGTRH